MTREEHLAWCKQRAMEYVNLGEYDHAVASMLSDLSKHDETAPALRFAGMLMLTVKDRKSATEFVQGFN